MASIGGRIAAARMRAGFTQASLAHAISVERSVIAKIETAQRGVSALELSRVAEVLGERIEWLVSDPPRAIVAHRNLQDPGQPSAAIDTVVERVARNVEFLQHHDGNVPVPVPEFVLPPRAAEAERVASDARALLGLDAREPVLELSRRVAEVGLLGFSLSLGVDTADAASIMLDRGGIAVVNGTARVGRRRLALAHELGHFLVADDYSVDWRVAEYEDGAGREARLDRFARAVLLPPDGLTAQWKRSRANEDSVRVAAVRAASLFRVDMSTLARRLHELKLADPSEAAEVRGTKTTKADIVELDLVVSDELEPPDLPRPYVEAVLRLYRGDRITSARALDLLLDTWTEADLPPLPTLPESAIWQFV